MIWRHLVIDVLWRFSPHESNLIPRRLANLLYATYFSITCRWTELECICERAGNWLTYTYHLIRVRRGSASESEKGESTEEPHLPLSIEAYFTRNTGGISTQFQSILPITLHLSNVLVDTSHVNLIVSGIHNLSIRHSRCLAKVVSVPFSSAFTSWPSSSVQRLP